MSAPIHTMPFLKILLKIMVLRAGPQDLRSSFTTFYLLLTTALCVSLFSRLIIPDIPIGHAIANTLGEYLILLYGSWLLLKGKNTKERFIQMAIALTGISLLGDTAYILIGFIKLNDPLNSITFFIIFGLQALGFANTLKHSLEITYLKASIIFIIYFVLMAYYFSFTTQAFSGTLGIETT